MSNNIQNGSLKENKLSQILICRAPRGPHWSVSDSSGLLEAATLYICGHTPTNAYAILASRSQEEFKDPRVQRPPWDSRPKVVTVSINYY